MTVTAICPSCRQPCSGVGEACPELGCKHKGYHGVPPDCAEGRVDSRVGLLLADKYLLIRLLGKGGMGVVMVALQQPLLREVALKVISGVQIDDTMRARFTREARAVAALDHPNVVKLVDFGVAQLDEAVPFMVMELVTGAEPMRKVLAGWRLEPPTWKVLADVFGQLLAGLDAAHERGIVHRDVKPDNVMCKRGKRDEWFVKVLDFGLAKSFDHAGAGESDMPSLTEAGMIVGTPQYMAPEQLARTHFGPPDARVDLYAVGVILFELLVGRRPYRETEAMALVFAKLDPYRDPLLECTALAELGPMETVVRRAMAWAATERYATADEFIAALAQAATELGPHERVAVGVGKESGQIDSSAQTIATPIRGSRPPALELSGLRPLQTPHPDTRGLTLAFPGVAAAQEQRQRKPWLAALAAVAMIAVIAAVAGWLLADRVGAGILARPPAPVIAAPAVATAGLTPAPVPAPVPAPAPVAAPTPAPVAQPAAATVESAPDVPAPPASARAKKPAAAKAKKSNPASGFGRE